MVRAPSGLIAEIKIDKEEGKKKEDNYAKRVEAGSRAWSVRKSRSWRRSK
jgi:hypothetical protein